MRRMRVGRHTAFPAVIALGSLRLAGVTTASPASAAPTIAIAPPVATGQLRVTGGLRDGRVVTATGLRWRPGHLTHGDRLLSFEVSYRWQACPRRRWHARLPGRGRHHRHAVRGQPLHRGARRHGPADPADRDRERGRRDRSGDVRLHRGQVLCQRHDGRAGGGLPRRESAGYRIRERHARAADRVGR